MIYGFQNVENRIRREYPIFRIVENLSLYKNEKLEFNGVMAHICVKIIVLALHAPVESQ
jgi:hypothetical protein